MISHASRLASSSRNWIAGLLLAGALAPLRTALAGTWTPLTHPAPSEVNLMLLLSDGTVMCAQNDDSTIGNAWFRLTPDIHGSYVNGTWTILPHAHDTRLFYPSQILRDGRVFVAGGEYGSGGPRAEVYDPQTNVWTQVNPPASLWNPSSDNFFDCNSEMLPDGRVLLMPVFPHTPGVPLIYNPVANTWSNAGHLFRGTYQDEATWVKLTDDSILTIDPFGTFTERYIPSTNTWVDDGIVPVPMYDPFAFELGGALLLPNNRAFFLGSTGHTAIYQPSGTPSPGTWSAGPDIPGGHGTPDAPAAMLVTGDVLCAVSPIPTNSDHYPSPTSFYVYNSASNSFSSENGPNGPTEPGPCYGTLMLDLPDGTVLFSHFSQQLYVYAPTGGPIAAGKPTITGLSVNGDGSYHLVGTGFNGISEGATYGDDFQMNSNYPLVRLSDGSGNVFYARTFGWSSTGVNTGSTPVTTEFVPPTSLPPGTYTLVVVANGFASDPISFGTFQASCFGDGSIALCPCFNFGVPGHGCDNSGATGGALLTGSGTASLAADTIHLTAAGEMPAALSVLLQGDATIPPAPYGDGLRCTGGTLKRLFARNASGGAVTVPQTGDPTISARSAAVGDPIAQGTSRTYQIYYRDPSPGFCSSPPGGTFNVSNAISLTWGP